VRYDQPDEDDRAGDGHGRAGEQGDRQHGLDADRAEPAAKGDGGVVTERHAVQRGPGGDGEQRADRQKRRHSPQQPGIRAGERAG
jgi:hypothetical protein